VYATSLHKKQIASLKEFSIKADYLHFHKKSLYY